MKCYFVLPCNGSCYQSNWDKTFETRLSEWTAQQRIDMGIAMLHFEITCKELNLNGVWQVQLPYIRSEQEQYLVSWLPKAQ